VPTVRNFGQTIDVAFSGETLTKMTILSKKIIHVDTNGVLNDFIFGT